ncbi:conserved unknown protein [Ectocarpus siliculosus]|uniref:Dynactin subunit 4 n=1 Tax=Ectocarpus siliculosus TaxID=2880 RepID=D7FRF1_ECTSI|nr:conserved unknown protein [Ectocarpus siliculosus]|eukprot:CBJ30742.1 conserved unknown protein [Ectocarpus siliculosus]
MAEVLYGDYNGYLRPLSLMYFSLDSRCLVADHPRSVQEEVESHFCPHCTSFFRTPDAMSAENSGPARTRASSHRTQRALAPPRPLERRRVAVATGAARRWSSALCSRRPSKGKRRPPSERGRRRVEGAGAGAGAGAGIGVGVPGFAPGARTAVAAAAAKWIRRCSLRRRVRPGPGRHVSDLDEAVARRAQVVVAASRSVALPRPPAATAAAAAVSPPWALREDTTGPDPALWTLSSGHETAGLAERVEGPWSSPPRQSPPARGAREEGGAGGSEPAVGGGARGGGGGVPRRVRLRARVGKRCRKDLAAGRTGILIKATFNPLDGDSSTAKEGVKKTWFKKDCSAALSVPRITVASLPSSLALLGPTAAAAAAAAASKTAAPRQQGGREEDDRGGKGSEEVGGHQPQQQQQPSLVLRLANPQITLLRLRVATENGPSSAESDPAGNTAAAATAAAAAVGVAETSPPGAEQSAGGGGDGGRKEGRVAASASSGSRATGVTAAAATALAAGGGNPGFVTVRPAGWGEGDWVHLEGREDEIIRQPGDRYRLPRGLLSRADDGGGGDTGSPPGAERSGRAGATPFLLHQQGDVAWVRVPFDKACADRVAAAVKAAAALPVLDVRFSLVMGEGEGGSGDDISMPIAVRFPLSSCPS